MAISHTIKVKIYLPIYIGALFILIPFLYAYLFCVPYGDDFDEATKTMFLFDLPGAIYDVVRNWLTWSGRYAYHFFAVFLGSAVFYKPLLAIANLIPIIIFFWSATQFFGYLTTFPPKLFACFSCILLYCNFSYLWVFYSFMDSFSIGLQWGIYFIFFYLSFRLLLKSTEKNIYRYAILFGIIAIGIYETAALAVLCTTIAFLLIDSQHKLKEYSLYGIIKNFPSSPFFKLFSYFTLAITISFLAPGNFARAVIRSVPFEIKLKHLSIALPQWIQIQISFFSSIFAFQIICFILLIFLSRKRKMIDRAISFFDISIVIGAWILFSLMVVILLAFTDMPLGSTPKFDALLHLFQALTFGIILFLIFSKLSQLPLLSLFKKKFFFIPLSFIFLGTALYTSNFQKVAINAANGELLRFYNFFIQVENNISKYTVNKDSTMQWPSYGIIGELQNPKARQLFIIRELPEVVLDEWNTPVFPILRRSVFNQESNRWPNPRASWFYRVGSIKVKPPDFDIIFEKIKKNKYFSYSLQKSLMDAGIEQAILVYANSHLTDPLLWIAIKLNTKNIYNISTLVPDKITYKRLLPIPMQRFLYEKYKVINKFDLSFIEKLIGPLIRPLSHKKDNEWAFLPLFGWSGKIPEFIYISLNDKIYEKISLIY